MGQQRFPPKLYWLSPHFAKHKLAEHERSDEDDYQCATNVQEHEQGDQDRMRCRNCQDHEIQHGQGDDERCDDFLTKVFHGDVSFLNVINHALQSGIPEKEHPCTTALLAMHRDDSTRARPVQASNSYETKLHIDIKNAREEIFHRFLW